MFAVAAVLVSVLATWQTVHAGCEPDPSANKPNIIFILADDLGFNDVSWNNPDEVETPFLQAMGDNGIFLDRNYAQPVCSPSRGGLYTGMYAHRIGMQHTVLMPDIPECLDPSKYTILSQELKGLGYINHYVGKWHLGFCDLACTPTKRGFDTFYGFYNAMQDHYTHDFFGGYEWWDNNADGETLVDVKGQHSETITRARAVELIANHDTSKPLHLSYSSAMVHWPIQLPEGVEPFDDIRKSYLGMVTYMDASVGAIVQATKDAGIYDNTIFIFSSDNGGQAGPYGYGTGTPWASNHPLRGAKHSSYEGGTRVPGLVHSPLQTVTGVRTSEMLHIVDWYPTLLDMAGACPSTDVDGVSQTDLILNNGASARDELVYNIDQYHPYPYGNGAIRMGDFKLFRGYPGEYDGYHTDGYVGATSTFDPYGINSLIAAQAEFTENNVRWSKEQIYAKWSEGRYMLFNVMEDPEERTNLADQMPDKVAEMSARLDELFADAVPVVMEMNAPGARAPEYNGVWTPGWCPGHYSH